MRAIFLTNLLAASMKAPKALDIHGRQLEFAPNGSTPVDERAFHDAWVRAMVERPTLIVDLKLSSAKIGGAASPRELGIEFGDRLEKAGFTPKQIRAWLGADPESPPAPVEVQSDLAEKKSLEEASRRALEEVQAQEKARLEAEEAVVLAAAAEQTRKDADALAELEAEEKAKKDAEEAALAEVPAPIDPPPAEPLVDLPVEPAASEPVADAPAPASTEPASETSKPASTRKRGR